MTDTILVHEVAVKVMGWLPDPVIGGYDGTPEKPKGKKRFESSLRLTWQDAERVVEKMRKAGLLLILEVGIDTYRAVFEDEDGPLGYVVNESAPRAIFLAALKAMEVLR